MNMSLSRTFICCLLLPLAGTAAAEKRTPLLAVDLETGSKRRIDPTRGNTGVDRELDALLDKTAGGPSFSTRDLEQIDKALRRFLKTSRPRAVPRLLLFIYPGRISKNMLKELRDIKVDIELVVNPCGRSFCADSVAKHIELLGRALKQAVIRTSSCTIRFNKIVIRTSTTIKGTHYNVYRFQAQEVVKASKSAGGGRQLIKRAQQAKRSYASTVTRSIAKQTKKRRLRLVRAPRVNRSSKEVQVDLEIKSDRNRLKPHIFAALIAAVEALRKNPLTPGSSQIKVVAHVAVRGKSRRVFTCIGRPIRQYLDGKISRGEIWSTYVVEEKQGGTHLTFDDDEASGRGTAPAAEAEDRTSEILAAHFKLLPQCHSLFYPTS